MLVDFSLKLPCGLFVMPERLLVKQEQTVVLNSGKGMSGALGLYRYMARYDQLLLQRLVEDQPYPSDPRREKTFSRVSTGIYAVASYGVEEEPLHQCAWFAWAEALGLSAIYPDAHAAWVAAMASFYSRDQGR